MATALLLPTYCGYLWYNGGQISKHRENDKTQTNSNRSQEIEVRKRVEMTRKLTKTDTNMTRIDDDTKS